MAVEPTSMQQVFTHAPDLSPFSALPNQVPLNELNPSLAGLTGLQREWAVASNAIDSSRPDVAGEDALNRVIWYATKGYHVPYPGDDRVLRPSEVPAYAERLERQRNRYFARIAGWRRPTAPPFPRRRPPEALHNEGLGACAAHLANCPPAAVKTIVGDEQNSVLVAA
jgi:hypothetical protein